MNTVATQILNGLVVSPYRVIKNFYAYRHLMAQMVMRDIKGRFAGSMGGIIWNFVHPVVMLLVYLFVFIHIFKLRIGSAGSSMSAVFLMSGLFPWIILAEGLLRGTLSPVENANLIQKTSFPTEILPAKSVIAPFLSHGIALLLLALYRTADLRSVQLVLFLPVVVILQVFFTVGLSFITSTLTVFFRDAIQLVQIAINFWIFLTPILYPESMLPTWAKKVMIFNPLYPLISLYQGLFLEGGIANWSFLLLSIFWSSAFFTIGSFLFSKLKYEFADWL